MKSKPLVRLALWLLGAGLLATVPLASTSMEGCGESGACTQLRQTMYANKETWDSCNPAAANPDDECIFVPGNPKDCTGVLTCEFAVNRRFRAEAEQAVYNIGQQSQGCYLCAMPNCISANLPYCEPVSRRCIMVTGFANGVPTGSTVDAGAAPAPAPTSTSTPDSGAPPVGAE